MAGVLRTNIRRLHQTLEVPATASIGAGLQVRAEAMADRRDRQQDRTVVLSLLVSKCFGYVMFAVRGDSHNLNDLILFCILKTAFGPARPVT